MIDLYEAVRLNPAINKLAIGDFLFAQFTCGIGEERVGLWAHTDYLVNVVTGRKTWNTADGVWVANPGESLFFRKGAAIVDQHYEVDFCLLMFFIPDGLVRSTVRELAGSLGRRGQAASLKCAARVENDTALSAFLQSMRLYFSSSEKPSEPLLRLKLKELIVSILLSAGNPALSAYFRQLGESDTPSLPEIMEANYRFHLSLDDYARLCHRSLSSFKRDFSACFHEPPARWLLGKRLDYSAALLRSSEMNVTEAAFESGFENASHFSRAFKQRFRMSPQLYRQSAPVLP